METTQTPQLTITAVENAGDIRIFINGTLHLFFQRADILCLQSWKETEHCCKIELYTRHRSVVLEYNSREKWRKVLELLDKCL